MDIECGGAASVLDCRSSGEGLISPLPIYTLDFLFRYAEMSEPRDNRVGRTGIELGELAEAIRYYYPHIAS